MATNAIPMFPVYLYEEGFELPTTGTYYLVARSGIFIHKETKAGNALVPVRGIPWLEDPSVEFRLKLPKVPGRIIGQAYTFFRRVFEEHKSEAYVSLLYSSKANEFRLWCPNQTVSAASVDYEAKDLMPAADRNFKFVGAGDNRTQSNDTTLEDSGDWHLCGTIHSHCDFSAYHSATDIGDEASIDGVHITIGHVNRKNFSMSAQIAINGKRETLEPENCCSGVVRVLSQENKGYSYMSWSETFSFNLDDDEVSPEDLAADAKQIEEEWMPKVVKKVWAFSGGTGTGFGWMSDGVGGAIPIGDHPGPKKGKGKGKGRKHFFGGKEVDDVVDFAPEDEPDWAQDK